jgi:hypothetical protein
MWLPSLLALLGPVLVFSDDSPFPSKAYSNEVTIWI